MVQKNLIIFLALLWIMPQFTAERSIIPQFRKMNKVNYQLPSALLWQSCLRGSRPAPHLTLYTCSLRSWKQDNQHVHASIPPVYAPYMPQAYRDKHRCYLVLMGQVAALEEGGSALSDQVTGEDSESEVEVVGGINVCLAQAMSQYQWEE